MRPRGDAAARPAWGSRWGPVAAYIALMFAVSSVPHLPQQSPWPWTDKAAHTVEYGALGYLLRRALGGRRHSGVAAVVLAAVVGGLDEVYQATVPGRFSSVLDWCADVAGSSIGALLQPLVTGRRTGRVGARTEGRSRGRAGATHERGQG